MLSINRYRSLRRWFRWALVSAGLSLMMGVMVDRAAAQPSTTDTRFLGKPAITSGRIAFTFAEDIWTAKPDGSDVRRITSHPGIESNPRFSPDGKTIAFTGEYDGNFDVFAVPAEGGIPKRLTFHPGTDDVRGWTPDGKAVLFMSSRESYSKRTNLFTVPIGGGPPTRIRVPAGFKGTISPDGKFLAYSPLGEVFRQWKHYRGGTTSRVWVLNLETLDVKQVPQPEGRCNDYDPVWIGSTVYFLSDRDGEFNIYSFKSSADDQKVEPLTNHRDFPVESVSSGDGKLIYDQSGYLYTLDPSAASKTSTRLKIGVADDLHELRPRMATGEKFLRDVSISPSGKRVAIEFRGEIVTIPAKKGDVRDITQTPGVHERSPAWSPDGKSLAYFSDASGEYTLHVRPQDGAGDPKVVPIKGAGFYERPKWSPDSTKIAFIDNSRTLYYVDLLTGNVTKIASEAVYGPVNTLHAAWSPDSMWLAYTITNAAQFQTLRLHSLVKGESYTINDGLVETSEPCFDRSGKYLYFFASTDAGPIKQWFDQSNEDMRSIRSIYIAVLNKTTPNPLQKPSDEEEGEGAKDDDETSDKDDSSKPKEKAKNEAEHKDKEKGKEKPKGETPENLLAVEKKVFDAKEDDENRSDDKAASDGKPTDVTIDLEGLSDRVLALPIAVGDLQELATGEEGQIYYIRVIPDAEPGHEEGAKPEFSFERFDLKALEDKALASGVEHFEMAASGKKLLYHADKTWGIVDAGEFQAGDGLLKIDAISVKVDPLVEWPQIFRDAWRINRDYFYAKNMHGADWEALRKKYEPLVTECATRADLNRVIRMLCSELSVGHSYLDGGDRIHEPAPPKTGLLGADFEVKNDRYQIKKVYGGLNWDTRLHAPLKGPGVDVKGGEYLLAVDGKSLKADEDVYSRFEGKAGKLVKLEVGPNADGKDSRTLTVEPIADEFALRNRDWVESNLKLVHEKTKGRCAYVYVPNTAGLGHAYFKRYFFPQADKEAIIVDERFNGGGSVADYYIDILRRPYVSSWATRYGQDLRSPGAAIFGPKVMITDETAGSGGDMLPWMFRKFKLGTIVGKRTWGGLVGILGYPALMDGGRITAPNIAFFDEEGYGVENVGIPPDIEVEQWPAEAEAGHDAQLEKAIAIVLEQLEKNPVKTVKRPPDPMKAK